MSDGWPAYSGSGHRSHGAGTFVRDEAAYAFLDGHSCALQLLGDAQDRIVDDVQTSRDGVAYTSPSGLRCFSPWSAVLIIGSG